MLIYPTAFFLFGACETAEKIEGNSGKTNSTGSIVVYSGRGESLVGELFQQAEQDLGFKIQVQYGSTPEMVTRVLTEGDKSMADVVFAQDSGHLDALAAADMLTSLDENLLSSVKKQFRDDEGLWMGTSGRLRVLVYDTRKLRPEDLPPSLKDLSDPKWKDRIGWAPGNGSFQSHVSALRHLWGDEDLKNWLTGMKNNLAKRYPKNSPQVKATDQGSLEIGWVNHYYLHRLDKKNRNAENYSFSEAGDAGNILMLSGLGIRKGSTNTENAEKLVKWMTSEKAQNYFAMKNFEYPTVPGIKNHPDVPELDIESLAPISQSWLADIGPVRKILQELDLN